MKELKNVVLLLIIDWVVTFLFYITGVLVLVGKLVQNLLRSPAMPFSSFFVNILLIVLIGYILNQRFIKASKKIFIISQGLFGVTFLALLYMVFSAFARGILSNA